MKHYLVNQNSDPVLLIAAASAVLKCSSMLCSQTVTYIIWILDTCNSFLLYNIILRDPSLVYSALLLIRKDMLRPYHAIQIRLLVLLLLFS